MFSFILSIVFIQAIAAAEMVCYSCYGNSSTVGQYCSIDHLCTGKSCYFNHDGESGWDAGCSDEDVATTELVCQLHEGVQSGCTCAEDFCNNFDIGAEALRNFWSADPPFKNFDFHHPNLENNIMCMECGNVSINGLTRQIPCTEQSMCLGQHCVTKRGQNPRSFCGTSWETTNINVRCNKVAGAEEVCICPEQLCNVVLPPEADAPPSAPTTTTTTTTTVATTTTKQNNGGKKKCKNNLKFSPNAQAVFMGEKLKALINGQFGSKAQQLNGFNTDIDNHICNYADEE
ncbi:unnamed protein product [Auanema sp. JU1783]|nr:unnamed protein product [Auanema sp. JU1783]